MMLKEKFIKRKRQLRLFIETKHSDELCQQIDRFINSELNNHNSIDTNNNEMQNIGIRKWLFMQNNFNFAITAIHLNKDNKIVNNVSIFPSKSWDGEGQKLSGQLADTFTTKGYQGLGLFDDAVIASINKISKKNHPLIFGFPNQYSLPGYIHRMNFAKAEEGLITYIKRISSLTILLKVFPKLSKNILLLLRKIDPVWASNVLGTLLFNKNKNIAFQESVDIGEEFDKFWLLFNRGIKFLNARDSMFIKWRYLKSHQNFKVHKIIYHGEFSGYLVTLDIDDHSKNLKNLWLVDWFYDLKNKPIFEAEIIKFLKNLAVNYKANNIIIQQSLFSPLSITSGFKDSGQIRNLVIHQNNEGKKFIEKSYPWHFTLGDTDHF